jgi:hypothetical protein
MVRGDSRQKRLALLWTKPKVQLNNVMIISIILGTINTTLFHLKMKKAIGILCLTVSLVSLGWKLSQTYLTIKSNVPLTDIGYLKVSENAVIQIKNGIASNTSGSGGYTVNTPINYQIDGAIYVMASISCLLAGVALLKKERI